MYIILRAAWASSGNRERSPIVSASDRDPFASGLGPSTFIFVARRRGSRPLASAGLSPGANSRGRAPPPSRATVNCARFAGSSEVVATKKYSFFETARFYLFLLLLSSLLEIICSVPQLLLLLRSRLRVAELRYLFDLSASRSLPLPFSRLAPWAGRVWALRSPPHFLVGIRVRYYSASSSSICTKQKDRLTVIPLFSPGSSISIFFTVSARVVNHITAVQMISA